MIIELRETEQNIINLLKSNLCGDFNFAAYAHPGSLDTLGFPINKVTTLLRFKSIDNQRPANLTAPCINQINELSFEVHVVYIDYRSHYKIYDLAKAISNFLRGRKDLIVFCEGIKKTSHFSFINDFRFQEINDPDRACYSYSFDLVIPYSETYKNKL